MHLSKFTDYSLRVLIYLATKPDEISTIDEISKRYGLSKEHLRKIIHHLAKENWIESRRGRGGGVLLARPARDISIGEVVRSVEEGFNIAECFDPNKSQCQIDGLCRLTGMLGEALNAFLAVLDQYTLADIVQNQDQLLARLGITLAKPEKELQS
ncbi:Rrf2 family transcriptional regulator [Terasakiella sp. A23]|uniref:RrF2 family transcriptional regulator n=1 Tax=Terasakiella sp. FCG-A23 TaxID=3080561 RepID=UPI0029549289|nr:Rrf2 family transcriptional regulator [Terasakiella sp. A23]MDV7339609.1 Rrf2 family transcriptional regulator [Terasakiella sp. A23]